MRLWHIDKRNACAVGEWRLDYPMKSPLPVSSPHQSPTLIPLHVPPALRDPYKDPRGLPTARIICEFVKLNQETPSLVERDSGNENKQSNPYADPRAKRVDRTA
ncbi:hypothetical protein BaRGS_00016025 [Batillaria attramentaria]|uniref:Uncharacterized protein n=1 Tax=Batillaria attramentaria TaxID=370345 RepID=A0ABD0L040_9CAEN